MSRSRSHTDDFAYEYYVIGDRNVSIVIELEVGFALSICKSYFR